MAHRTWISRRILLLLALFAIAAPNIGCGGGGGGNGGTTPSRPSPVWTNSTTAPAPNLVTMTGSVSGDTITVTVNLTGPTTSSDIYGFAFDIIMSSPGILQYVTNSAQAGNALQQGSCPAAPIVNVGQNGQRIVIGVTKQGDCPGNQVDGTGTVLTFQLKSVGTGSTNLNFTGSPSNPINPTDNPTAVDHLGQPIPSITFDTAASRVQQS